jgi:hypothetical protein
MGEGLRSLERNQISVKAVRMDAAGDSASTIRAFRKKEDWLW